MSRKADETARMLEVLRVEDRVRFKWNVPVGRRYGVSFKARGTVVSTGFSPMPIVLVHWDRYGAHWHYQSDIVRVVE